MNQQIQWSQEQSRYSEPSPGDQQQIATLPKHIDTFSY